jgi:hypothetical protein
MVHSIASTVHLCDLPLQAQVRHQRFCVAVEAHVAYVAMRACRSSCGYACLHRIPGCIYARSAGRVGEDRAAS